MNLHRDQLISRLKQQPRHGQAADPLSQVTAGLKQVFDLYKVGGDEIIRLNVFGKLADQISGVVQNLSILQDLNQELSEGFNINGENAAKFGVKIDKISRELGTNSQKNKQYAVELRNLFVGTTKIYNNTTGAGAMLLKQSEALRNRLGLTAEANESFARTQTVLYSNMGITFEQSAEQFADVAASLEKLGYEGAMTDILDSFTDLEAKQRVTFGRMPHQLGLALAKTKLLGASLSTLTDGAQQFLDVESAIAGQLEFQLLTGEELTTQKGEDFAVEMQKAVLAQDANRQVELYAGLVEKYGDDLRDNVYLQQRFNDIAGISVDDAFKMYEQLKAQKLTHEDSLKLINAQVDATVAANNNFEEQIKLGDERSQQVQQQDRNVKAQINALGDYSEEVKKLNAGFQAASDATYAGAGTLANQAINKGSGIIGTVVGAMNVGSIVVDLLDIKGITTRQDRESLPMTTIPKQDVFIPASAGTVVSGPFGSFALDSRDDVLAMPGIRDAVGSRGNGSGESVGSAVAAALKGMSFHVTNVFDGQKIRSSLQILDNSVMNNTNII